jgi:DNA processing protein
MTDEEKKYWIGFSLFPGIGPMRFDLLIRAFGSAKAAWRAPRAALENIGLGSVLSTRFDSFRSQDILDSYVAKLASERVGVLTRRDTRYPKLLAQISDAPFVLYIKGKKTDQPPDLTRTIAVVGTRKVTKYGVEVTRRITHGLVANGFTIVSGLAYGVDAVAHQAAIDAGGKTIAVLGCGIDIIAPPVNARLYHAIGQEGHGALVSEMPLGLRPNKGLFPARNRIISGLSMGVLVTEGAEDSGALITARYAAEQGREVFAVPGPITSSMSRAPAKLLKNGAKLVETVDDILEEFDIQNMGDLNGTRSTKRTYEGDNKEERILLSLLSRERRHMDDLVRSSGLTTAQVAATLTVLEINGIVKNYGDAVYGLAL